MDDSSRPFVVAVSGGIDSMALLHMLHTKGLPLVVAHVDHGIRKDSGQDERLVRDTAGALGLPYVSTSLGLGQGTSEDDARQQRYRWLDEIRRQHRAKAIVTAHHADDVVETIIFNVARGTGWKGLASLRPQNGIIIRPLLHVHKPSIVRYAIDQGLTWRHDSTNDDLRYSRNYIRHGAAHKLGHQDIKKLLRLHAAQLHLRRQIDTELEVLVTPGAPISRHLLIMSPDTVGLELLAAWLQRPLERPRLRRLLHFAKTARRGARFTVDADTVVVARQKDLIVPSRQD